MPGANLLAQIRGGDPQAFKGFVAQHHAAVQALALGYAHDPGLAEVLATRAWRRFLASLDAMEDGTPLHVQLGRQTLAVGRTARPAGSARVHGDEPPLAAMVRALPEPQRVLVTLRDGHGWSDDDACGVLDIPPAHGRATLHAARQRLMERLVAATPEALGAA